MAQNDAPSGVATTDQTGRAPESGPSDTDKAVNVTSPDGTKATVPERMVDGLTARGWKKSGK